MVHGSRIIFRRKHWFYSAVLLSGLLLMMYATTAAWLGGLAITKRSQEWATLSQFTKAIEKDYTAERADVPSIDVRLSALVEATTELSQQMRSDIANDRLVSGFPEDDIQTSLAKSYQAELEKSGLSLESKLPAIQKLSESDTPDFEGLQELGRQLGETGVTLGKLLRLEYEFSFTRKLYTLLFHGLFVSLGSAMFSLLGVYIAAAAFRAFRVKTLESSLMMVAAVIVMLGQIPFYVYIYDDLPLWRQWLLEVPNSAAFRAIKIGAAVAGLVMAFRMWFSIESESFSEEQEGKA